MADRGGLRRFFQVRPKRWAEKAVDQEIRHHLEMRIDELVEEGHRPDEARRIAEDAFGDLDGYRAECVTLQRREVRKMRWKEWVFSVFRDVAYGFKGVRRHPGFSAAVVLTLALGIGANTAIFAVVDATLLRPVNYPRADELVTVSAHYPQQDFTLQFFDREGAHAWMEDDAFLAAGSHARLNAVRTDGEEATQQFVQALSPELFALLETPPRMGRAILPEDAQPDAPDVVLLSARFWAGEMGGDPDVVGRTIVLDDRPHTIIGVMPASFRFPYASTRLYVPLRSDGTAVGRTLDRFEVVGRLDRDVPDEVHEERLAASAAGIQEFGPTSGEWRPRLLWLGEARLQGHVTRGIWTVFGAVGVLLLIAIVNGVNLMLTRGTVRARELAVRLSLGASRGRVVRQLTAESLVLALLGGVAAGALAMIGAPLLLRSAPQQLTWLSGVGTSLDARVPLFTFGISLASGLALGLIPAVQAVRAAAPRSERLTAYAAEGHARQRLRPFLVVVQVALSLTLLFGAGLLARSFVRLIDVDPGFEPEGLAVLEVNLGEAQYPTGADREAFDLELLRRLRRLPGVVSVARSVGTPPNTGVTFGSRLEAADRPEAMLEEDVIISFARVGEGYLSTIGARLLAGRAMTAADRDAEGERRVVIGEHLARELWGTTQVQGRRFRINAGEDDWYTVVGVVADIKLMGLESRFGERSMLLPFDSEWASGFRSYNLRLGGEPADVLPRVREALAQVDSRLPVSELAMATDRLLASVDRPRFFMTLMLVFAGVALALAGVGIYGVLAFAVSRRRREMGIRLALGAQAERVRRMVLRDGLALAVIGTALGLAISWWSADVLSGLLFETDSRDLLTMALASAAMLGVAAVACWVPARRATRVDPREALRAE